MPKKYICIAGKNEIAVHALEYVYKMYSDEYEVLGLPTSQDLGVDNWQPSFKKKLKQLGIKEVNLDNLYILENLIFISLEYDKIINPTKFKTNSLFNIHFSYLPAYKGMYTSAMPLLQNESYTGVTLHCIDKGIDTGKIICQTKFSINDNDDAYQLYLKYNKYAFILFKEKINDLLNNSFSSHEQSFKNSSYFSKQSLNYAQLNIDFKQTALSIKNQIRAFAFRPYQFAMYQDSAIRFAEITTQRSTKQAGKLLHEDLFYFKISSIDYDVVLYKDYLEFMFNKIKKQQNQLVKKYIALGYPLDDKNDKGWDLLIVATYFGNKEIFDLLIKKGANIHTTNYNKTNLLMYALTQLEEHANTYFFERLIQLGLDVHKLDGKNKSTLDWIKQRKLKFSEE